MRNKFLLVVMMLFMAMGSAISAQSKTGGGGGNPQPMQCIVRGMERTQIRLPFIS